MSPFSTPSKRINSSDLLKLLNFSPEKEKNELLSPLLNKHILRSPTMSPLSAMKKERERRNKGANTVIVDYDDMVKQLKKSKKAHTFDDPSLNSVENIKDAKMQNSNKPRKKSKVSSTYVNSVNGKEKSLQTISELEENHKKGVEIKKIRKKLQSVINFKRMNSNLMNDSNFINSVENECMTIPQSPAHNIKHEKIIKDIFRDSQNSSFLLTEGSKVNFLYDLL